MNPRTLPLSSGIALLVLGTALGAQTSQTLFRRPHQRPQAATLDLSTGTITRGPRIQNKSSGAFSTEVSLFNNDLSGFVGVDSGLGPNGPCEWITAATKGLGRTGGKSGYLTGFEFVYCSSALDPLYGGPGGAAAIGFRSDYLKGTEPNASGPSGVLQGQLILTGLPANTACTSFFGGFQCYTLDIAIGPTPVCLPDGPIGWSWRFDDLGTDGALAKTFPFLACVQSCSGPGPDGTGGMTDSIDRYCPAGTLNSSFSFGTAFGTITSVAIELREAQAIAATSVVSNGSGVNPVILANTSSGVGAPTNAPVLGESVRLTVDCTNGGAPGRFALLRMVAGPTAPPILTPRGEILVYMTAGTGMTFIRLVPESKVVNFSYQLPKNLCFYGMTCSAQALCPRVPGPGFLSNALLEKVGSH